MSIIPKLNPAKTYKAWPVNAEIFNYPKWKGLITETIRKDEFNKAWQLLFKCQFEDCQVDYGSVELFNNTFKGMLVVQGPFSYHYRPFVDYTDEPILSEDQTIYYDGAGCTWSTDVLGQRFYLIDSATMLPVEWEEVYAWEAIKRYQPFVDLIRK